MTCLCGGTSHTYIIVGYRYTFGINQMKDYINGGGAQNFP